MEMKPMYVWRWALLAQYAVLVYVANWCSRIIGYEIRHGGHYSIGCCFDESLPESLLNLGIVSLFIASIIGLIDGRLWARRIYTGYFVLQAWLVFMLFRDPSYYPDADFTIPVLSFFGISAVLVLFFFTAGRGQLGPKPAPPQAGAGSPLPVPH